MTAHYVSSSSSSASVRQHILQSHLSYLGQEDSPAKLDHRRNLEALVADFLSSVPHAHKFIHPEITDILDRSVLDAPDFSAYRAGAAFQALEKYAANLLAQPWRKEYRLIKLYGGFFSHLVRGHLVDAERVLHLMGYTIKGDGILALEGPVDPDRVARVSLDCIVAYVECQIMVEICEKVEGFTWQDVYRVRRSYPCAKDEAIRILRQIQQVQQQRKPPPVAKLKDLHQQANSVAAEPPAYGGVLHSPPVETSLPTSWPTVMKSPTSPPQSTAYLTDGYPTLNLKAANRTIDAPSMGLAGDTYEAPHRANVFANSTMYHPPPPKEPVWDPLLQDMYYQQDLMTDTSPYGYMPRSGLNLYHHHHGFVGKYPSYPPCYDGYLMPYKPPDPPLLHMPSPPCHCCHLQPPPPPCIAHLEAPPPVCCAAKVDEAYYPHREKNYNTLADLQMSMQQMTLGKSSRSSDISSSVESTHIKHRLHHHRSSSDGVALHNGVVASASGRRSSGEKSVRRSSAQLRRESFYDNLVSSSPEDTDRHVPNSDANLGDIDTHVPYAARVQKKAARKPLNVQADETPKVDDAPKQQQNRIPSASNEPSSRKTEQQVAPSSKRSSLGDEQDAKSSEGATTVTTAPSLANNNNKQQGKESEEGGDWSCSACTYINKAGVEICEMCSKSRRRGSECLPLISGGRECPRCTLVNDKDTDTCTVCDASLKDCPTYI